MGSNANVVGAETTVEAEDALLLGDLGEAVCHAAVGDLAVGALLLLLETGLDKVKGEGEEGGEEAGDGAGAEGLSLGGEVGVCLELGLGLAEEGELAKVEGHGSDDGGSGSGPEGGDSLVLGDGT